MGTEQLFAEILQIHGKFLKSLLAIKKEWICFELSCGKHPKRFRMTRNRHTVIAKPDI